MSLRSRLQSILDVILDEADRNHEFAAKLRHTLGADANEEQEKSAKRTSRRAPAQLDPMATLVERGEAGLRAALAQLDIEQLKDVIADYGMDPDKLAMKWKTADRLIDRIVTTAVSRSTKGNAFRQSPSAGAG